MAYPVTIHTHDSTGRSIPGGQIQFNAEADANVATLTAIDVGAGVQVVLGIDHRTALTLMAELGRFAAES